MQLSFWTLECWQDDFITIEKIRCGNPCLYVLCGICGMKETSGSLMILSVLLS